MKEIENLIEKLEKEIAECNRMKHSVTSERLVSYYIGKVDAISWIKERLKNIINKQ